MDKSIIMLALLLLPASSAFAETVFSDTGTDRHEAMARVITRDRRPADCLAAIEVNRIDGESIFVSALGFDIQPGVHTLNGRALLDTRFCMAGRDSGRISAADLEVNFEADKTYYIGFDYKPNRREDWQLVVWKVE